MLLGKSKLGKFYPVFGLFLPNQISRAVTQWKVKKSWAHDTGQINVGQILSNNLVIIAQLVG